MPYQPPQTYHATPTEVAHAFLAAAFAAGLEPNHELIAMLLSHSALETGHWAALRCFNFGNVKAHDSWVQAGGSYTYYEASEWLTVPEAKRWLARAKPRTDGEPGLDTIKKGERINAETKKREWSLWFWASSPQARFRAFDTLAEGASQYLAKLMGRYADALEPALGGDPKEYVERIYAKSYFTAGLSVYRNVVTSLYHDRFYDRVAALGDLVEIFP